MPAVGALAPDFTLRNQFGEEVTLSELRGRAVTLMFYPAAFTGRCTGELCELRDNLAIFEDGDVELLAISTDPVPTLAKFAEDEGYRFQLLSDFWPHGEVAKQYDAFIEERGIATRATYVIDKDGKIAAAFRTEPSASRDLNAYREAIAALA